MHFELICKIDRLTDFASLGQCMARILNVFAEKLSIVRVSNERVQERLGARVNWRVLRMYPSNHQC